MSNRNFPPAAFSLLLLFLATAPFFSPVAAQRRLSAMATSTAARVVLPAPKIQVAILLDVSNSMDGLIAQAKSQLWNMVSVMGRANCKGATPRLEIALYEYGRTTNNAGQGYVKQIDAFTTDLDGLSQHLFNLNTQGGDEYCGHVIYKSVQQLNWDTSASSYKVIFIAGNEDFLQGDVLYTIACAEARKKGVVINTIYCGSRQQGILEHWNLGGECGGGTYTNIDQNAKAQEIATPFDNSLVQLNNRLNGTYIAYGSGGAAAKALQSTMDKKNEEVTVMAYATRIAVKGEKKLYRNTNWDLVDAAESDSTILSKVDLQTLPDSLKKKSRTELKRVVAQKTAERNAIRKEIKEVNAKREKFIAAERQKLAKDNTATLETEIEKIIRQQAKRYNMEIR
ncbi:vWA domain-containing protein [Paraflavisolibacter sp. H34]|uniref:vWA domain-containing protein n=1 Tax=Huijunlia imazamoxiresistens TaxID=3127457 RepID=UPI0030193508